MLYYDFLKKKLSGFMSSEFLSKNIEEPTLESSFNIEIPSNKDFGDISTNIAMVFAKKIQTSPKELASSISQKLKKERFIKKLEIVGPGFLNIFFQDYFWQDQLKELLKNLNSYKYSTKRKRVCVEFVSANPTGLMHIGHARGAVLGDTIASLLEEVGHYVIREYYINDAGEQIKKLIKTVDFHNQKKKNNKIRMHEELYPGEYLEQISDKVFNNFQNVKLSKSVFENKIINLIMDDIKKDLLDIKIQHDSFISEKENSVKKNVDQLLKKLEQKKLVYSGYQEKPKSLNNEKWKKEKLLLFKSQKLGDESDRALMKPNGELTYFMTDIIYHQGKINKNYDILLNIWGSDHSGYVNRLENALKELNQKENYSLEIKLTSLVNLLEGKKVMKMSKRDGNYITLREVVKKVGPDVLRFMMISRNVDKKIDFDFEIIKSKTKDNPVFYIQYAYARCMSLIEIYKKTFKISSQDINITKADLSFLDSKEERILIIRLCNFFNIIMSAAKFYEPHRIANYLYDLSRDFHAYWGQGKINHSKKIIIDKNIKLSSSRIILIIAISGIIRKGMKILKIECPENM